MPEYKKSAVLEAALKMAERALDAAAGEADANPTVAMAVLESMLIAREQLGVQSYGVTLDDQKMGSRDFWIRMGLEEVLDGMMYFQKAALVAPAENLTPLNLVETLVGVALVAAGECYARVIDNMHKRLVDPTLFPPCDLKEEARGQASNDH